MSVSDTELTSLAASHDIISLGMLADDARRRRHGARTTFVRVANVALAGDTAQTPSPLAGEVRIVGTPASRAAAVERVAQVAAAIAGSRGVAVSGFSLADLEELSAREGVTLRALLEALRAAGFGVVAGGPVGRVPGAGASVGGGKN